MLDKRETQLTLEHFFNDCLNFWKRRGCDDRKAFEHALEDTNVITTDTFSPCGDKLDEETKVKFIHYREMDLGIRRNDNIKITYDVSCFERELIVIFPNEYENYKNQIWKALDDAYYKWHSVEEIEDEEERRYVENSCCEEFMIDELSLIFNQWIEWKSEYYGNDVEEMDEVAEWIQNKN